MFTDVQFMTVKEKELVLKNWKTFLQNGLKKEHFTKRLYDHLQLHCGFIACYNIHGFYATYFEAGQDTEDSSSISVSTQLKTMGRISTMMTSIQQCGRFMRSLRTKSCQRQKLVLSTVWMCSRPV